MIRHHRANDLGHENRCACGAEEWCSCHSWTDHDCSGCDYQRVRDLQARLEAHRDLRQLPLPDGDGARSVR